MEIVFHEEQSFLKVFAIFALEFKCVVVLKLVDEFEHDIFHVFECYEICVAVDDKLLYYFLPLDFGCADGDLTG